MWKIKRIPRCRALQPLSGAILPKIKACTFIYIPAMCMRAVKALAIFRGRAGSSEPSLRAYATGTIMNWLIIIKMQNRATINLFIGTCMCVHYTGNTLVGPSMYSFMRTNRQAAIAAQQFVKMFHFEEFDVFD